MVEQIERNANVVALEGINSGLEDEKVYQRIFIRVQLI